MTILVILLGSIICYFVSQSRKDSSHNLRLQFLPKRSIIWR